MDNIIQTDQFQFHQNELKEIQEEMHHYEDTRAASIEALKIIQKYRGWVPDNAIAAIAKVLKIAPADVEGVATFYSQIFRQPVGRNIIRVCDSMVCFIAGYENISEKLQLILKIKFGETTQDNCFTLLPVCCLGNCDKAPTLMINNDTHSNVNINDIEKILELYR